MACVIGENKAVDESGKSEEERKDCKDDPDEIDESWQTAASGLRSPKMVSLSPRKKTRNRYQKHTNRSLLREYHRTRQPKIPTKIRAVPAAPLLV